MIFRGSKKADKAYDEAMANMKDLYNKINSNIPDWPLFDFPIHHDWVDFPKGATVNGIVSQKGLHTKNKHYKVVKLKFSPFSEMRVHTHYGYWEYIFILNGTFEDIDGKKYKRGDNMLVDGYFPHTLKSLTGTNYAEVIMIYADDKRYTNIKYLRDYLKQEK